MGFQFVARLIAMRSAILLALLLAGCADARAVGSAAIEHRRMMNDAQARGTVAAMCDLSIGSVYRLPYDERQAVLLLCGDRALVPLRASEGW